MKLTEAKNHLTKRLSESVDLGGGLVPIECDGHLNIASERVVRAMAEEYGTVYLGKVNLHREHERPLWEWDGTLETFCADFVSPVFDEELERLILWRHNAPYQGTSKDYQRLQTIHQRMEAIGAAQLCWS